MDELDPIDSTDDPLVKRKPLWLTLLMSAIIVANTALTVFAHFGTSAVLKTTINPNAIVPDGQYKCELGASATRCDSSDFETWAGSKDSLAQDAVLCTVPAIDLEGEEFVDSIMSCIKQLHPYTDQCVTCFGILGDCGRQSCSSEIFNIIPCLEEHCLGCFYSCSGFDYFVPDSPPSTFKLDCATDNETMYDAFEISFVNTIETTYKGNAYFLMIVLVIASGIWPYVKNIMITIIWFGLVPTAARKRMMSVLLVFGKWSLVDVYAVIILVIAVRIFKELTPGAPLYIIAEPRAGILAFLIAALSHMIQAEWIHLESHRHSVMTNPKHHHKTFVPLAKSRQITFIILPLISCCLLIAGAAVLNVFGVNLQGVLAARPGDNSLLFTAWSIGSTMFESCVTGFGNTGVEIGIVLGLFQIVSVVLLPIICTLALGALVLFNKHENVVALYTLMLSNFAAADVFVFSLLAMLSKFKDLIESAIGQAGTTLCPGATPAECLRAIPSFENGMYLIVASVPLFWLTLFFILRTRSLNEIVINDEEDSSNEEGKQTYSKLDQQEDSLEQANVSTESEVSGS